ncbi:MAG: TetR family transcriptional regulator C-terminal domain-containing protein [Clostridiales bacterium]|jgi:AcrR family transcriptional regulator|nr:TetR family transcriptional regulator C-terminal domain-containing protein [Clostridiales bacterium]
MYKKITNSSAVRSQKSVSAALIELMNEMPYEDITVTDICQKACVVRKTFYRNFNAKGDVVQYILDDAFKLFSSTLDLSHTDIRNILEKIYTHIKEKGKFIVLLVQNGLVRFVQKTMVDFINAEKLYEKLKAQNIKEEHLKYLSTQIAVIFVGMVETWAETGFVETPNELAEITRDLMYGKFYD